MSRAQVFHWHNMISEGIISIRYTTSQSQKITAQSLQQIYSTVKQCFDSELKDQQLRSTSDKQYITLSLLMSHARARTHTHTHTHIYIYGAPCKAISFNVYIYIYMDLRLATLKAVSFYLLHNVSTPNQSIKLSCGTVVCKHFTSYQGYLNYRRDLIRYAKG
jgi:hypothetical protein